jgi:hypothetical protein
MVTLAAPLREVSLGCLFKYKAHKLVPEGITSEGSSAASTTGDNSKKEECEELPKVSSMKGEYLKW